HLLPPLCGGSRYTIDRCEIRHSRTPYGRSRCQLGVHTISPSTTCRVTAGPRNSRSIEKRLVRFVSASTATTWAESSSEPSGDHMNHSELGPDTGGALVGAASGCVANCGVWASPETGNTRE